MKKLTEQFLRTMFVNIHKGRDLGYQHPLRGTYQKPQIAIAWNQHRKTADKIIEYLNDPQWVQTKNELPKNSGQFVWVVPVCRPDKVEPAQWCHINKCFMWASGWFELDEVICWTDMSPYIPQAPQQKAV